jgi:hypothetical protein
VELAAEGRYLQIVGEPTDARLDLLDDDDWPPSRLPSYRDGLLRFGIAEQGS